MASKFFWPLDMAGASPFPIPQFFHSFGVEGEEFGENRLFIQEAGGRRQGIEADTFILAAGGRSREKEWSALRHEFQGLVYFVGDVTGSQGILEAVSQGNRVGRSL